MIISSRSNRTVSVDRSRNLHVWTQISGWPPGPRLGYDHDGWFQRSRNNRRVVSSLLLVWYIFVTLGWFFYAFRTVKKKRTPPVLERRFLSSFYHGFYMVLQHQCHSCTVFPLFATTERRHALGDAHIETWVKIWWALNGDLEISLGSWLVHRRWF